MSMATLQLYKNKYRYPHYSETLTAYGSSMPCTPVGINLKSGSIRVKGDMRDFMSCNYLALDRDGQRIYAWIDNVQFLNSESFTVSYSVDAWRTFKNRITLGTQFIARQPGSTTKKDPLLGSSTDYPEIKSILHTWSKGGRDKRVLVVQVNANDGEIFSNTPVNPTPYQFFMKEFDINNWVDDTAIDKLMTAISGAETKNIVTMYSIPYMDLKDLSAVDLPVIVGSSTELIPGFKMLRDLNDPSALLMNFASINIEEDIDSLLRVPHSVQVVIPEAGILTIPDELLVKDDLQIRQDVDLFSGACNYMLQTGGVDGESIYAQSVRGSSISSIPVVSDPLDTYLSQNQNALATSLIGDMATIVGGAGTALVTGGIGGAVGGGLAASGVNNIIGRMTAQADMATHRPSNPPAFLGTALASNFNQVFWVVVTKAGVENATSVHSNFGYPINLVKDLKFPDKGFIQTEGCNVYSTDGSVPSWAIDEINGNFNRGILVH